MANVCKGTTKNGDPCGRPAGENGYCSHHSAPLSATPPAPPPPSEPKKADDKYEIARKRREKAKARAISTGALPGQRLVAPPKPGFVRRWVNDEGTRIDSLMDKGYTFVEDSDPSISSDDPGGRKSMKAGVAENGNVLRTYLMEISDEYYQEDQEAREQKVKSIEDQVRRAKVGGSQGIGSDPSVRNPTSVQDNLLLEE